MAGNNKSQKSVQVRKDVAAKPQLVKFGAKSTPESLTAAPSPKRHARKDKNKGQHAKKYTNRSTGKGSVPIRLGRMTEDDYRQQFLRLVTVVRIVIEDLDRLWKLANDTDSPFAKLPLASKAGDDEGQCVLADSRQAAPIRVTVDEVVRNVVQELPGGFTCRDVLNLLSKKYSPRPAYNTVHRALTDLCEEKVIKIIYRAPVGRTIVYQLFYSDEEMSRLVNYGRDRDDDFDADERDEGAAD